MQSMFFSDAETDKDQTFLDEAWNILLGGDIKSTMSFLSKRSSYGDYFDDNARVSETIRVTEFFLSYDFNEIENVPAKHLKELSQLVAWRRVTRNGDCFRHETQPYAPLIGTGARFNLDIKKMYREMYGPGDLPNGTTSWNPVQDSKEISLWPELRILSKYPMSVREVLLLCVGNLSNSGLIVLEEDFVSETRLLLECFSILSGENIIDTHPNPEQKLMLFTVKELRQFAADNNVRVFGAKHRIAEEIVSHVNPKKLNSFIKTIFSGLCLQILIDNCRLFKNHIRDQTHLLDSYITWLENVQVLGQKVYVSSPSYPDPNTDLTPRHGFDSEYSRQYLIDPFWSEEVRSVREIWDPGCDLIIRELCEKYQWFAGLYIEDAIRDYLPKPILKAFDLECIKGGFSGSILSKYGEARVVELGIKFRIEDVLNCRNCEKQFLPTSVTPYVVKRVDGKVLFCDSCYNQAFLSDLRSDLGLDKNKMLDQLLELSNILEAVPTYSFVKRPMLINVPIEKQVEIVCALAKFPPADSFKSTFGSWLKALILAGVLDDGTMKGPLGIRCLALDGHECLSMAEKTVDDWMYSNGIPHEKEFMYPDHPKYNPSGRLRADWRVENFLIEYAGLLDMPDYAATMETKKSLSVASGFELIVLGPEDILNLAKPLGVLLRGKGS